MTPDFISTVQRANAQLGESNEPLAQFLMCEIPSEDEISKMIAASEEPPPPAVIIGADENERYRRLKDVLYGAVKFSFYAHLANAAADLLVFPRNAERTVAFRALVDAKEAAERACRLKPMPLGSRIPV